MTIQDHCQGATMTRDEFEAVLVEAHGAPRASTRGIQAGDCYAWGDTRVGETDCPLAAGLVDAYVDGFRAVTYDGIMADKFGKTTGTVAIT